jgi:indolepyruvate ferredoxin oxidoreductase
LSVLPHDTEFGEKRRIHDLSCNRDYTCLVGDCPSFVTITPLRHKRRRVARRADRAPRSALPSGDLPDPEPIASLDGQYGIYFTGIGGTGVVTANRILATAAEHAGLVVSGLDQTGLSQKAGSVVSHLHFARDPSALASAAVGERGADLYLSGDILQAAAPAHLAKVARNKTIAVVDRDVTPTATMLQSDLASPDVAVLQHAIEERVGTNRAAFIDSRLIAEEILGDHLLANVVVLGAAYQLGGLPFTRTEIDRGIDRQGATAAVSREAFEWGRWAVHDPEMIAARLAAVARDDPASTTIFEPSARALSSATTLVSDRPLPAALRDLLTRRTAQVVDYQDVARATRFLGLVERVAARDDAEHDWVLTRAVAEAWFKLLTYKDEYEVARLHLKADYDHVARDLGIAGAYSVTYHLHPPILRRLGVKRKVPLGRPYEFAFRALRGMRRLRGTPFDVFGWDRDRRTERAVIDEYERLVDESLGSSASYDSLVRIAASPMSIKGYGPIKERAVDQWRAHVSELGSRPADHAVASDA